MSLMRQSPDEPFESSCPIIALWFCYPDLSALFAREAPKIRCEVEMAWKGKNVLVIGSGNSGHDIAQDLYSNGAKVTLVQRSSTLIVNVEPSAQLPYTLYDEGPSLEDCDLITASIPLSVAKRSHILLTQQAKKLDKDLLDGLERKGFKLDFGEDGTGWQFKYLTRGGGYYFNVGCAPI